MSVVGVDLTAEFCDAATELSRWVGLSDKTKFQQGDALNLAFDDCEFDAAITVHVAMNIENKMRMYEEARRILSAGGTFAVYDILRGAGEDILYPVPWARDPSISHLATPDEMETLLADAGFEIVRVIDSTEDSLQWLEARTAQTGAAKPLPVTTELLFGPEFREMTQNQLRGLKERRILTVSYICKA
ncbi:Methyltransferase domain-containing protein [Ruegeria marina]|uniref:Methyltransferase domain-containing protein n=1 Tax=Ruegeria marina TaxID=639004 RepID=A0A1G6WD62_9RHOB|nr:class I SAM-dependent methyltransferase [Ruegeria marina]SDD63739.1 Methyltransferase domain-containing protein [Ruegeria marina]